MFSGETKSAATLVHDWKVENGWLLDELDHLDFHGLYKYDSYLEITHLVRASCRNENCLSKSLLECPRFNP